MEYILKAVSARQTLKFLCGFLVTAGLSLSVNSAYAKVDLVTLPTRANVQLTIYNSTDLTLVKENRILTLKEGMNELQFSWANTLIDPTSLEMLPKDKADKIEIDDLTFPPRVQNLGLWHIQSGLSGEVPVEIGYLTSGLSWRAFYLGTLNSSETAMRLEGFVRVTNNSGEDYENAQVRLIVGKVHMIDQIAELAQRQYPFGRPGEIMYEMEYDQLADMKRMRGDMMVAMSKAEGVGAMAPTEIIKEGLSEYFLYTIEGRETIPTGWSKRLPSFDARDIPVVNLYKYEEERYGSQVTRFLNFKNDKAHKLGETPIPDGQMKVFRSVDELKHLSYEGQSNFKYIPVDEDVELNLGPVENVIVEAKMMGYRTDNYRFDSSRNIAGWDEFKTYKIEVKNTRDIPVKVEIQRNFNTPNWKIKNEGDYGNYEKVDMDTAKYTLALAPKSKKEFTYELTILRGQRADQ